MKLLASAITFAALALFGPAEAVVGGAGTDARYADRTLMILTRGVEGAGFCTAVVLSPRVVMTAAHCARSPHDMRGFYRDAGQKPIFVDVEAVVVHPEYRADAVARRIVSIDLALVRLASPLPSGFDPAQLAAPLAPGPEVGASVVVAGYGLSREADAKSGGVLRSAPLAVRAPSSQILLWSGGRGVGTPGACQGDSGGPIFGTDGETVVALVAWSSGRKGRKCGDLTQGPLIGPLRPWIDSIARRW